MLPSIKKDLKNHKLPSVGKVFLTDNLTRANQKF